MVVFTKIAWYENVPINGKFDIGIADLSEIKWQWKG